MDLGLVGFEHFRSNFDPCLGARTCPGYLASGFYGRLGRRQCSVGFHSRTSRYLERAIVISSGLNRRAFVDLALSSGRQERFVARSLAALAGAGSGH